MFHKPLEEASMLTKLWRSCVLLAIGGIAVAVTSAPAYASTGSTIYAPDQVGYAATGARFQGAEIVLKLPDAGRYAPEVGSIAISLQLWSKHTIVDYMVFACTDSTCKPGGKPESLRYHLSVSLYNRATHSLTCSTNAATARQRCSFVAAPSARTWNRTRLAAGRSETFSLYYDRIQELMMATAFAGGNTWRAADIPLTVGALTEARVVVQFGSSPFSEVQFHRPKTKTLFLTLGTFQGEFGLADGRGGYITSSLWTSHKVDMTPDGKPGREEAIPGTPYDYGAYFHLYFL
jgi:hypothetical protein